MNSPNFAAPALPSSTPHILLVEDDPTIRAMLQTALQLQGYLVSQTDNRREAIRLLQECPTIAVVILDLGLPPHTHSIEEGIATLREIEAGLFSVKVVVLTGQEQDAAALAAIREGAFDFLAKPASSTSIMQAVQRSLLFLAKERQMQQDGFTRIAINAHIGDGLKNVRDDAEEKLVRQVLKETGFNVHQSAKRLGVKRENIYYFLKKFGIQRQE